MGDCDLLIVDDQPGIRRLLYEVLSEDGYRVEAVAGGREAIDKAVLLRPRLILLDMKMPGMNGLETLIELNKVYKDATAVILMTAYGELEIVMQAQKLGVNHYINKPFDLEDIRALIKSLIPDGAEIDRSRDIV
ncbi:response regulator receiver protein [Desulfofarcimen acetoxidans DSM 771]|uniref:Stage 0 sporulation protein A homolog n=1 Tax=Desulfofarcimen acetoxidans (strain ATCC 49208 / DSM 771 / KCTC 5769 / VKM B-1644 / 5575) TaxID=485916 RepID=C8VVE9_DESAS|nr:response regulator [Desulfofarcimen acetoxidans]ACV61018.1 response regulator receiver protein [Desulfofarcimen acetoxidans DSM 771]